MTKIYKVLIDISLSNIDKNKALNTINKLRKKASTDGEKALCFFHAWRVGGKTEDRKYALKLYEKLRVVNHSMFYTKQLTSLQNNNSK